jgi:hypothetical protein
MGHAWPCFYFHKTRAINLKTEMCIEICTKIKISTFIAKPLLIYTVYQKFHEKDEKVNFSG